MPAQAPVDRLSIHPKSLIGGNVRSGEVSEIPAPPRPAPRPFPKYRCVTIVERDSLVLTVLDYLATAWVDETERVYICKQVSPPIWTQLLDENDLIIDAGEF